MCQEQKCCDSNLKTDVHDFSPPPGYPHSATSFVKLFVTNTANFALRCTLKLFGINGFMCEMDNLHRMSLFQMKTVRNATEKRGSVFL